MGATLLQHATVKAQTSRKPATAPRREPVEVVDSSHIERALLPPVVREFRGVWVASVSNIDWPSQRALTTAQAQAELLAILDKCVTLRLNAVVLQIRPAASTLR